MATGRTKVAVLHPTMPADGTWIDDFVQSTDEFEFVKIAAPRETKSLAVRWWRRLGQGFRAFTIRPDVIVVNFPHLTMTVCIWKALLFSRAKVIAWSFNIPPISNKLANGILKRVLKRVDVYVSHSHEELGFYPKAYGFEADRFLFVPMQRGALQPDPPANPPAAPYIIAMGSMQRDYKSFFKAMEGLDARALVIASDASVAGLDMPDNVELRNGLTLKDCYDLNAAADFMVLPISSDNTASGHITLTASMALGVPIVATECPSTDDYMVDGREGLLVPPEDPGALRAAIEKILGDRAYRDRLADGAKTSWKERYSDEAAGRNLANVIRYVLGRETETTGRPVPVGY